MQFKLASALFFACMTLIVSAAPVPVEIPPLDIEARSPERVTEVQIPREANPEPICGKYACL
ncbi:hypothetical protein D9613_000872 [Agrocybe pediades]|uniref:Uncharacterized protein n=1 Tax=Agrocybe pediades TaxID=84607 RepID=A0A8H4R0Y1_9AGAR|nr:hypothetical protein D9613_000872 [Agrocybe pediades]KAF9553027.1 hypothetical protein CPC08DRAFT_767843 [Agrocybe pediades]